MHYKRPDYSLPYCRLCHRQPLEIARTLYFDRHLCPECNAAWEKMALHEKAQKGLLEDWEEQLEYDEYTGG